LLSGADQARRRVQLGVLEYRTSPESFTLDVTWNAPATSPARVPSGGDSSLFTIIGNKHHRKSGRDHYARHGFTYPGSTITIDFLTVPRPRAGDAYCSLQKSFVNSTSLRRRSTAADADSTMRQKVHDINITRGGVQNQLERQ